MRLVVQIAAGSEWQALEEHLGSPLPEETPFGPPLGVRARRAEVRLLRGGVGKVLAAAPYAILTWRPELLGVLGTSGAVHPGLQELDLVVGNRTVIHGVQDVLEGGSARLLRRYRTELSVPWSFGGAPYPAQVGTILTGDVDITAMGVGDLRRRCQGVCPESDPVPRPAPDQRQPGRRRRGVPGAAVQSEWAGGIAPPLASAGPSAGGAGAGVSRRTSDFRRMARQWRCV